MKPEGFEVLFRTTIWDGVYELSGSQTGVLDILVEGGAGLILIDDEGISVGVKLIDGTLDIIFMLFGEYEGEFGDEVCNSGERVDIWGDDGKDGKTFGISEGSKEGDGLSIGLIFGFNEG
jgi:hypothetical protein